jgi:hypothetical protein
MGRPRKRQFVEVLNPVPPEERNHRGQGSELPSSPVDGLEYTDGTLAAQYFTTGQPLVSSSLEDTFKDPVTAALDTPGAWLLGDQAFLPPINFGDVEFGTSESNSVPLLDPIFHLSPSLPTPPTTDSEGATSTDTSSCSCLSSIYLSLAALQQLPSDIATALKVVRRAAYVAAQTIWCPQCGAVLLTTTTPLIEAFQNTMLLGTLLPIVAHGYQRLLDMVDKETNAAIAANETKTFSLHDYGGLCGGNMDPQDALPCVERDLLLNSVDMPPIQWRTTVRALLRVDIYGHESPAFTHKGLKDLVGEMEYRQRTRHELLDAAQAAGTLDTRLLSHGFHHKAGKKCGDSDTPHCLQMIKMARHAIDQLLIA